MDGQKTPLEKRSDTIKKQNPKIYEKIQKELDCKPY